MIEFKDHEKIGNDHHLRRLSIVKQVLFVSSIRNVQRTVWRICILMLGFKRVKANFRSKCYFCVFCYCLFLITYCIKCHFVFLYNSQQTFIFWRLLSHFGRQKAKCSVYWIQVRNLYWSWILVFNLRSHWLFEVTSPLIGWCYYLVLVLRHSIEKCVKEILVSESLWKWNDCLGLSY